MDKYEKIRIVGRGAYGIVHLCQRLGDKKLVIIKQIPVEQMTKEERLAALNEVKVLSMLSHPNIIEYYENFLEDKALMIVMEYAPGGTLFEYLQQRNGQLLEEQQILRFFAQMLLSLQHVHSKQIMHRDLKTQNVLLDKKREVVKIGDFGISKVLSSKSKAYSVVGTPSYISPELCEGKPYNQKSDIWALGCVLYELASLKRAFEAQTLPALILKIMRGMFAPISDSYSDDLRQLILSMLHLDPKKRPMINQIMAQPFVMNALMHLYTDFGKVPCRRIPRPLSSLPGTGRGRGVSRSGRAATSQEGNTSPLLAKPMCHSTVYFWGSGLWYPTRLPLPSCDTDVVSVSAGRTQKTAITKNGRLIVWETPAVSNEGDALPGSTGTGTLSYIPRYLESQSAVTIKHVSCGDLFTACLTDRGILMTFGSGASGCLGHGNFNDVSQAKIVEKLLGCEVIHMSCGASHVLAITNEDEVYAWGRGENGRLGLGTKESHCSPQEVPLLQQYKLSEAVCGLDCSILLTSDSKLLCCGSNRYNKLALDEADESVKEVQAFTRVRSAPLCDLSIKMVATGSSHTVALTHTGECYTFGSNQFGQLGYIHMQNNGRTPQKVAALGSNHIDKVACGDTFTVAVSKNGDVLTWGKGTRGRLGRQENDEPHLPRPVNIPAEEPFVIMSLSCSHWTSLLATKPLNLNSGTLE